MQAVNGASLGGEDEGENIPGKQVNQRISLSERHQYVCVCLCQFTLCLFSEFFLPKSIAVSEWKFGERKKWIFRVKDIGKNRERERERNEF